MAAAHCMQNYHIKMTDISVPLALKAQTAAYYISAHLSYFRVIVMTDHNKLCSVIHLLYPLIPVKGHWQREKVGYSTDRLPGYDTAIVCAICFSTGVCLGRMRMCAHSRLSCGSFQRWNHCYIIHKCNQVLLNYN